MNVCKTQPLNKMKVTPMKVELKNERADRHPLKTTRIIPVPLPLQEAAVKQIEDDVNMGILENVTNMANHDLWLSPMLIVPKKDNTPRRVVAFLNLNNYANGTQKQQVTRIGWPLQYQHQNQAKSYSSQPWMPGTVITRYR